MTGTIRLLVTNGCSYTRGAELARPEREAWPSVLATELGLPVENLASDGGSNQRMVRTTVANLERLCEERGIAPECALVLCMWTGLARGECHRGRRLDPGNRPDLPYEERWHRLGRWRSTEADQASEAYFRELWDEEGAIVSLLTDWILLDAYFERLGAVPRYAYAWNVLPARLPRQARDLARRCDGSRVFGGSAACSRASFYELVARKFETGELYHPLREAHRYFALELAAWLRGQGMEFPL